MKLKSNNMNNSTRIEQKYGLKKWLVLDRKVQYRRRDKIREFDEIDRNLRYQQQHN